MYEQPSARENSERGGRPQNTPAVKEMVGGCAVSEAFTGKNHRFIFSYIWTTSWESGVQDGER